MHQNCIASFIKCSGELYTVCQKNVPSLTCYLDIDDPVTIIFGRSVTKKVKIRRCFVFPPHLSSTSALPCKTRKPWNWIFSLKHCMFLCQRTHKTHLNYHLIAVELPFIPKVIDCMHQTVKPA